MDSHRSTPSSLIDSPLSTALQHPSPFLFSHHQVQSSPTVVLRCRQPVAHLGTDGREAIRRGRELQLLPRPHSRLLRQRRLAERCGAGEPRALRVQRGGAARVPFCVGGCGGMALLQLALAQQGSFETRLA